MFGGIQSYGRTGILSSRPDAIASRQLSYGRSRGAKFSVKGKNQSTRPLAA
jgi:hypothetical protein